MTLLQTVALVLGAMASLVAVLAYIEPGVRALFDRNRKARQRTKVGAQSAITLPESGGATVPIKDFISAWAAFVPDDEPMSAVIPVGSEKARFAELRRPHGLDALCRTLPESRRDRMQVTNSFWIINGRYFSRTRAPDPNTGKVIDMVGLSESAKRLVW